MGLKVGELVKSELEKSLRLRPVPPILCPNCLREMRIASYVLSRPDHAVCANCRATWSDLASYDPMCSECGYSADHREGLGCRLEDG